MFHTYALSKSNAPAYSVPKTLPSMKLHIISFIISLSISLPVLAQHTVSGTITEKETGEVVPGASILVKATGLGSITDFEGHYTIDLPDSSNILVFSFVGKKTQEIEINGQTTINVLLENNDTELGEVVFTALGISKSERKLGYAATNITSEELEKSSERSMLNSLQGKVAGVNISSSSGSPGGESCSGSGA